MQSTSHSVQVKEFTEGASGNACPNTPSALNKGAVKFLIRMVMSELDELAATVCISETDQYELMKESFDTRDLCRKGYMNENTTEVQLVADQGDAMVDMWYYCLNAAARHGINLDPIFVEVHRANMAKRNPETGKFERRESDGKIIKPSGWKEPDINSVVQKQFDNGSWN